MKLNLEGHMKGRNFLFNVPEIELENFDFLSKTYFVNYLKVGTESYSLPMSGIVPGIQEISLNLCRTKPN